MAAVPSVSIGNYKGVMLCNRPFAGGVSSGPGAVAAKQAFVCGNVGDKLGANVPISSKDAAPVDRKPKKETALQRHRKWLVELQSTKLELEKQYASDAQAKEDRATRFMEREAKLRKVVKDVKYGATASSGGGGADDAAQSKRSAADDDADEGGGAVSQAKGCFKGGAATVVDGATAAALGRPMWAMTEDQALEAADQRDDDDCDELLDFAQGLDFDKYINDSEVSALITNVRARIAELETEATHEAKTESHLSDRAIDREIEAQVRALKLTQENLRGYSGDDKDFKRDDDAVSVARSVLDSEGGRALGGIHSTKSLAAVAERSKIKHLEPIGEMAIPTPQVVKHTDDGGSRLEGKFAIANLPYMHRNPAV